MEIENVLSVIDEEIARLHRAKAVLIGATEPEERRAGRRFSAGRAAATTGKRKLSPEAIERIREGQRRRWAKAKRAK